MKDKEQETLDLVGLIYDVAMQPDRWPQFLEHLAEYMHAKSAFFRLSDTSSNQVHMAFAHGIDDDYFSFYRDHFIHCDPYREALKREPAGVFYPGQIALSYEEFAKTEYYNELFKPRDLHYTVGGFALRDGPLAFQIATQRSEHQNDFHQEEIDRFNLLIPHLQRAFMINRHIAQSEARSSMAEHALDQLSLGIIFIDEQGVPIYINSMAEEIISADRGLQIIAGKLTISNMVDTQKLNQLIQQAIATGSGQGTHPAGAMRLVPVDTLTRPLSLLVTPLSPDAHQTGFTGSRICAAIFISSPEQVDSANPEVLKMLYNLTSAEARLAIELAKGCSLNKICDRFNVSKHTIRSQLKIIFHKTNTSRQAELVSLLLNTQTNL